VDTIARGDSVFMTLLANSFFLFALFPYISLVRRPFDTQPYAFLLSLVILMGFLAAGKLSLPRPLWALTMPAVYSIAIFFVSEGSEFGALRSIVGYVSVFAISAAAYKVSGYLYPKLLGFSVFVWLLIGVIQTVMDKEFGTWLLARFSTTPLRGVTSLAVEPSFYAVMNIFFILLNELFYSRRLYRRRWYFLILCAAVLQIILSSSVLGLLLLSAFLLAKSVSILWASKRARSIYSGMGLAVVTWGFLLSLVWLFLNEGYLGETRAGWLLADFLDDPISVLDDESVAARLLHIVVPIYAFISGGWTGLGLATWGNHGLELASQIEGTVVRLSPYSSFGDRILSGWGSALFELGVFGLIMIGAVSKIFLNEAAREKDRRHVYLLLLLLIQLVMISAVPLALPVFSLLVGLCARSDLGQASTETFDAASKVGLTHG